MPVQADDILVLASDGLSDNLWDEDILDEVLRFRRSFMAPSDVSPTSSESSPVSTPPPSAGFASNLLRRSTLAGLLSEALCSRARCVSERKGQRNPRHAARPAPLPEVNIDEEIPFARRAREQGRWFDGGKPDGECLCSCLSHKPTHVCIRYLCTCCGCFSIRACPIDVSSDVIYHLVHAPTTIPNGLVLIPSSFQTLPIISFPDTNDQ